MRIIDTKLRPIRACAIIPVGDFEVSISTLLGLPSLAVFTAKDHANVTHLAFRGVHYSDSGEVYPSASNIRRAIQWAEKNTIL